MTPVSDKPSTNEFLLTLKLDCGKQGRAPLAFKARNVSELFRYRNSPEGCETKRTIRCFIGERDGLGLVY
jgi:hypothetical protein